MLRSGHCGRSMSLRLLAFMPFLPAFVLSTSGSDGPDISRSGTSGSGSSGHVASGGNSDGFTCSLRLFRVPHISNVVKCLQNFQHLCVQPGMIISLGDVLVSVLLTLDCFLTYTLYLVGRFLADNLGGLGTTLDGLLLPLNAQIRGLIENLGSTLQKTVG
ncbi:uncharacterized protein LOC144163613 [Haemaphysalis longicornis]